MMSELKITVPIDILKAYPRDRRRTDTSSKIAESYVQHLATCLTPNGRVEEIERGEARFMGKTPDLSWVLDATVDDSFELITEVFYGHDTSYVVENLSRKLTKYKGIIKDPLVYNVACVYKDSSVDVSAIARALSAKLRVGMEVNFNTGDVSFNEGLDPEYEASPFYNGNAHFVWMVEYPYDERGDVVNSGSIAILGLYSRYKRLHPDAEWFSMFLNHRIDDLTHRA